MSWISGLADKAENLLNKIDQNAATALQIETDPESPTAVPAVSMQSLKITPSPVRSRDPQSASAEEDNLITDSVESQPYPEWKPVPVVTTSRRNSEDFKIDPVAIDVKSEDKSELEAQNYFFGTDPVDSVEVTEQMSVLMAEIQELAAFKIALTEVSKERDELRTRLAALSRDVENTGHKQRVQELELLLQRLTEERDQAQHGLHGAQTACNAHIHTISELETNLSKLQQDYLDVAEKLQMQIRETEQQRKELHDYRVKAQRALQTKDSLIAELKGSGNPKSTNSAVDNDSRLLQREIDALKEEQKQTLEENQNLTVQLEETRFALDALSKQHSEQIAAKRSIEENLRKELCHQHERALSTESEQRVLTHELETLRQQFSNQMAAMATRLQDKEEQLHKLRTEKLEKASGGTEEERTYDYSGRMQMLTKTLVEKQNALERITSERNALRLQLEKVQSQLQQNIYNNSLNIAEKGPRNTLLLNTTDDAKAQFPSLMRANPFDNRVSRRMKRAYSTLDSMGIRLGGFLRRYPLMRVFALIYVALLHLWVMFVLFSVTERL